MPCRSNFFGSTILGRSGIINIRRSSIRSFSVRGSSINFSTFSSDVIVERIEVLCLSTVEVEPPVADEVVLVEDGSVGTEEAVLGQTSSSISCADMENLTLSLSISIVTSIHLAFTGKPGLRDFSIDRVVLTGNAGNGALQHSERICNIRCGGIKILSVSWLGISIHGSFFLSSTPHWSMSMTVAAKAISTHSKSES